MSTETDKNMEKPLNKSMEVSKIVFTRMIVNKKPSMVTNMSTTSLITKIAKHALISCWYCDENLIYYLIKEGSSVTKIHRCKIHSPPQLPNC